MIDIAPLPQPRLEIRDLRVILALADSRTTTRAAAVLHLTQPAVSRALAAAEERLDARLFERTPRGLVPTAAGERFLPEARRLLTELSAAERRLAGAAQPAVKLRVVCECYTAYHWLPSALLELRQSVPELEVSLAVEHTRDPVTALQDGLIDVALLTTSTAGATIERRPLFRDEIVFLVASHHPLAGAERLRRADLLRYPLVTANVSAAEAKWFLSAVFGRKRPRLEIQKLPLTEAILDVTRAGLGIAVMSEWIAGPHLGDGRLVAKRLSTGPVQRPWQLAWRPEADAWAKRLHAALRAGVPHVRW